MALAGSRSLGRSSSGLSSSAGPRPCSSVRARQCGTSRGTTVRVFARRGRGDRRRPPPPDLPSLLFDQRIVYLGMPVCGCILVVLHAVLGASDALHTSQLSAQRHRSPPCAASCMGVRPRGRSQPRLPPSACRAARDAIFRGGSAPAPPTPRAKTPHAASAGRPPAAGAGRD